MLQHLAVSTARRPQGVVRGSPMIRPLARPPSSSSFLFFFCCCCLFEVLPWVNIPTVYSTQNLGRVTVGNLNLRTNGSRKEEENGNDQNSFFLSFLHRTKNKRGGGKFKRTREFSHGQHLFLFIFFFFAGRCAVIKSLIIF